jgi:hypothetical protein
MLGKSDTRNEAYIQTFEAPPLTLALVSEKNSPSNPRESTVHARILLRDVRCDVRGAVVFEPDIVSQNDVTLPNGRNGIWISEGILAKRFFANCRNIRGTVDVPEEWSVTSKNHGVGFTVDDAVDCVDIWNYLKAPNVGGRYSLYTRYTSRERLTREEWNSVAQSIGVNILTQSTGSMDILAPR